MCLSRHMHRVLVPDTMSHPIMSSQKPVYLSFWRTTPPDSLGHPCSSPLQADSYWWHPVMPDHQSSGVPESADCAQLPICPLMWKTMMEGDAEGQTAETLDSKRWPVNPTFPYERR